MREDDDTQLSSSPRVVVVVLPLVPTPFFNNKFAELKNDPILSEIPYNIIKTSFDSFVEVFFN
jgi:hypothetical protein